MEDEFKAKYYGQSIGKVRSLAFKDPLYPSQGKKN